MDTNELRALVRRDGIGNHVVIGTDAEGWQRCRCVVEGLDGSLWRVWFDMDAESGDWAITRAEPTNNQ